MTQTNISKERRLEIKSAVYNALIHSGICHLPIKIKSIARSYKNVRLISFSKHMKRLNISYEDMKAYAKTKDAFTDYYVNEDMFYIYYNDLDLNIVTSNRYRWNIAHELGHVLLNHHKNNSKTRIFFAVPYQMKSMILWKKKPITLPNYYLFLMLHCLDSILKIQIKLKLCAKYLVLRQENAIMNMLIGDHILTQKMNMIIRFFTIIIILSTSINVPIAVRS